MLILTSILLISFGVLSSATEDEFCSKRRVDHCFVPDTDVDFPDSEEALDKICPILIPRFKCMLDFKNKCSEKDWPPQFEILENVNDLLVEACDKDSKFHKELALHLPCIKEVFKSHRKTCIPLVREAMEEILSDLNIDSVEHEIFTDEDVRAKYICIHEALGMSCFVASASVTCGEKAGEMIGYIIDQVGFWEASCPENIHEEVKAAVAIVQPLMELGIAAEEIISKMK